jgi:hypothetical protein
MRSFFSAIPLILVAAATSAEAPSPSPSPSLVVHEWGTFTALQDENGDAIAGVNSQDEPLPHWTHDLAPMLIQGNAVQGAPKCHPDVTLRLETPVIYFHRRDPEKTPLVVDVRARFRGGWLTQFYPDAAPDAPGFKEGVFDFGTITANTVGELLWKGVQIGGAKVGPETADHVWLAPRKVKADSVTTAKGESERFLFYRGVAHVDAPVRVSRRDGGAKLLVRAEGARPSEVGKMWLVEVRADGTAAYRPLEWLPDEVRTSATFPAHAYAKDALVSLRVAMRQALQAQGLFADEAAAVLDTWELSYFESPGLRVFFMVPRPWTDAILPLDLSVPAEITRVMVGRIEIVTPEQRVLARELAASPAPPFPKDGSPTAVEDLKRWSAWNQKRSEGLRKLGRFGEALILDEERRARERPPTAP